MTEVTAADRIRLQVDGGKYTIVQPANGGMYVLRYNEPWLGGDGHLDIAGAKMVIAMAYELEELRNAEETRMMGEAENRDERANAIAHEIADASPWGASTDNWTRIYQAARAGAIKALGG